MKIKRGIGLLLAAVLCAGLVMPASAANLYFTSINDSVALLTSDTMPFWSGGILYVPYTVFDSAKNGIGVSLGLSASYNQDSGIATVYNLKQQMLSFDLNTGICRDDMTGTTYSARAVMRSGKPYLPLNMVCSFFGLEYSYNQLPYVSQGYLVRIKGPDTVLSDAEFIDAGQNQINKRLRDYTQSLISAETTDPVPPSRPSAPPEVDSSNTATYLAVRCESGEGLPEILDALDQAGRYALFFLSPQTIEGEGDLVRRILGTGHSVGILAEDEEELERGNLALEEAACTRTTLACVPAYAGLEEAGWVRWEETLYLEPSDTVGGTAFANSVISRLGNRPTVYLTLEGGNNAARVLPALLRQLNRDHYTVAVPMETRL